MKKIAWAIVIAVIVVLFFVLPIPREAVMPCFQMPCPTFVESVTPFQFAKENMRRLWNDYERARRNMEKAMLVPTVKKLLSGMMQYTDKGFGFSLKFPEQLHAPLDNSSMSRAFSLTTNNNGFISGPIHIEKRIEIPSNSWGDPIEFTDSGLQIFDGTMYEADYIVLLSSRKFLVISGPDCQSFIGSARCTPDTDQTLLVAKSVIAF